MHTMKISTDTIRDLYLDELEEDFYLTIVEEGKWEDQGKYCLKELILKNKLTYRHYKTYIIRYGTHWQGYDFEDYTEMREIVEVEKVKVISYEWKRIG